MQRSASYRRLRRDKRQRMGCPVRTGSQQGASCGREWRPRRIDSRAMRTLSRSASVHGKPLPAAWETTNERNSFGQTQSPIREETTRTREAEEERREAPAQARTYLRHKQRWNSRPARRRRFGRTYRIASPAYFHHYHGAAFRTATRTGQSRFSCLCRFGPERSAGL